MEEAFVRNLTLTTRLLDMALAPTWLWTSLWTQPVSGDQMDCQGEDVQGSGTEDHVAPCRPGFSVTNVEEMMGIARG